MNVDAQKQTYSGPKLTWEQIKKAYPNEWVVIVECEENEWHETGGVIFAHSPDRQIALKASRGLSRCAFFWTGEFKSPILGFMGYYDVDR